MNSAIDIHTHVAPSHLPEWANKHTPQSWHTFSVLSDTVPSAPFEQAQQLFFDALLLDSQTLMYPVNTFDVSLFMIVSVHPINFSQRRLVQAIQQCPFTAEQLIALTDCNSEQLLSLQQRKKYELALY